MRKVKVLLIIHNYSAIFVAIIFIFTLTSCPEKPPTPNPTPNPTDNIFTGWSGQDNVDEVPSSINFSFSNANLPASVDLTPYLPPVNAQGQVGTCVAWACAYYTKTASEATIYNYSSSQLASSAYQLSPKYLFVRIPENKKGRNCEGTDFIPALELLQEKGVATMANVPYSALGDCSNPASLQNWDGEAAKHKIKYFRKIDYSVQSIKQQLANKFPIIIGAKLSDNFLDWTPNQGPLNRNTTYNKVGIHALHALTIVGFDDSKNAFRIVNSWGTSWGDNGYIWIDYNFLINGFVYNRNLYIIASDENVPNPNPTPNPTPTPTPTNNGVDLACWVYSDMSTSMQTGFPNTRSIVFNIYNIGNQPVLASLNWKFYYLYYNAYNANDYGILFQDSFTNGISPNSFSCINANNCSFNYTIEAGSSFAQTVFNQNYVPRGYSVPNLTGYYYLILVADPEGKFIEQNEQNNLFYTTSSLPKAFTNGYSNRVMTKPGKANELFENFENKMNSENQNLNASEFNTAVNKENRNAYTPEEILSFLKYKIKTGEMKEKIQSAKANSNYIGGYNK